MPHYNGILGDYGPPSPVYHTPYSSGTFRSYKTVDKHARVPTSEAFSFQQCTSAFSLPLYDVDALTQTLSRSPVPTLPSVSPETPIIGACGGHCPGFEYVCYYILQVCCLLTIYFLV